MHCGIVVTRADHAGKIAELTRAMVERGHSVSIFLTDDGVKLIKDKGIANLRVLTHVDMSLCDFSARGRNITAEDIPEGITAGTQYQNSLIHSECDKVLIF